MEESKANLRGDVVIHSQAQDEMPANIEEESLIPVNRVKRVAHGVENVPGRNANDIMNSMDAVIRNEKQVVITKLRSQNDKLKVELKMLTGKLETFIEKSR